MRYAYGATVVVPEESEVISLPINIVHNGKTQKQVMHVYVETRNCSCTYSDDEIE